MDSVGRFKRINGVVILAVAWLVLAGFPQASTAYPNQPAGSTVITNHEFDTFPGTGWNWNGDTRTGVASDATSPGTTPNVLRMNFTVGTQAGGGAGRITYDFSSSGYQDLYFHYWWKPSTTWNGGSNGGGQKMSFTGGGNFNWAAIPVMQADRTIKIYFAGGGQVTVDNCHLPNGFQRDCPGVTSLWSNVSNPQLPLGQWSRIELYVKRSTNRTSRDGVIRWWVNGNLAGNNTTVNFPDGLVTFVELNATWGNIPDNVQQPFTVSYDQVRLSTGGSISTNVPLMITSPIQTSAQVGKPYSATLQAENGKAPYSWTISAGSLPPGLILNKTTGVLSGTPTIVGRSDFTIKALDSNVPAKEATKAATIIVSNCPGCTGIEPRGLTVNGLQLTARPGWASVMFELPQNGNTSLKVFDLSGRVVWRHSGSGEAVWNHGGKLKKGVYLIRAEQNGHRFTANFCILK